LGAWADWGELKLDQLRWFLPFQAGIVSDETVSRLFAQLDAQRFEACFVAWMSQLCPTLAGQCIAVDGKSMRGSHEAGACMAYVAPAWHTGAGLTLCQVRTAAKSNEITAIP
jgi:DDE_Tnp_1-associated